MDQELIQLLQEITPEEQSYLDGNIQVKWDIYTQKDIHEIDSQLFLKEGHLVTVRHHSRFVEFPAHRHNYIELMYVCSGTITHYIDGKELIMQEGDILLLNQQVKHAIKRAEYQDIGINFIALPEFFDIPFQMMPERNVIVDFLVGIFKQNASVCQYLLFHLGMQKGIENLMENMIYSMINRVENEDVINQYSMGLVFMYLINHMDCLAESSSQDYKNVIIQATLQYIDTQYKNANLGKLAKDFHQSLPVLSKMIRNSTGFTFQELLMRKRFQRAVMFLIDTDLSVEDIACRVGYENISYFYRQFKQRYGMTPKKYRTAHKNDPKIKL